MKKSYVALFSFLLLGAFFVYASFLIQSVQVLTCQDSDGPSFTTFGNVTGLNLTNSTYTFFDRCLTNFTATDWTCRFTPGGNFAVEVGENCTALNLTSCVNGRCV